MSEGIYWDDLGCHMELASGLTLMWLAARLGSVCVHLPQLYSGGEQKSADPAPLVHNSICKIHKSETNTEVEVYAK